MSVLLGLICTLMPVAEPPTTLHIALTVQPKSEDRPAGPTVVSVMVPKLLANGWISVRDEQGSAIRAQMTLPGLLTPPLHLPADRIARDLHLLLPALKANQSMHLEATLSFERPKSERGFQWRESDQPADELRLGDQPVLRYERAPLDDSTKARREATYKVFHHLFDEEGKLVTKGVGGEYTHHRGLFYGFRKTIYEPSIDVDTWHCTNDTAQVHEKTLFAEEGVVLGRHRVLIAWQGKNKEVFAHEERELTAWNTPGGRFVCFASLLRPVSGKMLLDGDPQHAGFHFRAANEVAARTKGETYFLRPDGAGARGATRNWPDVKNHANLPWDAMSFVLGSQRYTVAYLDHPANPKEARYSERDYGRFGSYFVSQATKDEPLRVRYAVWLQRGTMTGPQVQALSQTFTKPVELVVEYK